MRQLFSPSLLIFLSITLGYFTNHTLCLSRHYNRNSISFSNVNLFVSGGAAALASANASLNIIPLLSTSFNTGTTISLGSTFLNIDRNKSRLKVGVEYTSTNTFYDPGNLFSLYFCTNNIDQENFIKNIINKTQNLDQSYNELSQYLQNNKIDVSLIKSINVIFGFGNTYTTRSGYTLAGFTGFCGLIFNIDDWMSAEIRLLCVARESDFDLITGNSVKEEYYRKRGPDYRYSPDLKGCVGITFKVVIFIL
jgi:hypothetical protein